MIDNQVVTGHFLGKKKVSTWVLNSRASLSTFQNSGFSLKRVGENNTKKNMKITITITPAQAIALKKAITNVLLLAENSPNISAILALDKKDTDRVKYILATLPKSIDK